MSCKIGSGKVFEGEAKDDTSQEARKKNQFAESGRFGELEANSMDAQEYKITIEWSLEDGCYCAQVVEWPSITAVGDSREEALAEIQIALNLALEAAAAAGIAPPTSRQFRK